MGLTCRTSGPRATPRVLRARSPARGPTARPEAGCGKAGCGQAGCEQARRLPGEAGTPGLQGGSPQPEPRRWRLSVVAPSSSFELTRAHSSSPELIRAHPSSPELPPRCRAAPRPRRRAATLPRRAAMLPRHHRLIASDWRLGCRVHPDRTDLPDDAQAMHMPRPYACLCPCTRCAHAGITRIARIFKMSKNMQGMMVLARTLQKSVSALSMLVRPVACVVRWVA